MSGVATAAEQFEGRLAAESAAMAALEQQLANSPGSLTRIEKLGSEQAGFAPVLGLALLPQGEVVRGGVLLLHDSAQHPDWPDFTGPARQALAGDGWHTLSVTLTPVRPEARPSRSLPPRLADGGLPAVLKADTDANDAAPADASPEATLAESVPVVDAVEATPAEVPRLKQFSDMERVALGLAWLGQQAVDNQVLVGVGLGADTALAAYASLNLGTRGVVLVLVNATLGFTEMNELLKQSPGLAEAVILDIYDPDSYFASALAKGRKTLMQRSSAQAYQQRAVAGIDRDLRLHQAPVIRSMRGWLRRYAPGVEGAR
ncbi:DUF3530 family protein [Allohahella marinimesophila]|uniref:Alpha/beta hydrolase family protein n=1 Tax=Allohahella marinimesophila TaxID=1054972 RepID=A0ABP7PIS4_9GAMM